MTLKITPGKIESDGHVVLLPAGLTGEVTTADGTTYDLGDRTQIAIEVDSVEHGNQVAYVASELAAADDNLPDVTNDAAASAKALGLTKTQVNALTALNHLNDFTSEDN